MDLNTVLLRFFRNLTRQRMGLLRRNISFLTQLFNSGPNFRCRRLMRTTFGNLFARITKIFPNNTRGARPKHRSSPNIRHRKFSLRLIRNRGTHLSGANMSHHTLSRTTLKRASVANHRLQVVIRRILRITIRGPMTPRHVRRFLRMMTLIFSYNNTPLQQTRRTFRRNLMLTRRRNSSHLLIERIMMRITQKCFRVNNGVINTSTTLTLLIRRLRTNLRGTFTNLCS